MQLLFTLFCLTIDFLFRHTKIQLFFRMFFLLRDRLSLKIRIAYGLVVRGNKNIFENQNRMETGMCTLGAIHC